MRTRTRVNVLSELCGSSQGSSCASAHAPNVSSRVIASNGRKYFPLRAAIADKERAPEPRASPSNTLSD